MNRTRDYYRKQRARHIHRKERIIHEGNDYWNYGNEPGRLSKSKIHCSCWMCRSKSYDSLSISDRKKIDFMDYEDVG